MALEMVNSIMLRQIVLVDGLVSGAMGALLIVAAGPLSGLTGLSAAFLFWVGVALMPWVAGLVWLGRREPLNRSGVEAVIALNALWVVASIGVLVAGPFAPTVFGYIFIIAQALAVAAFAELQFTGLRRTA